MIDIGGPALLRSSSKNHESVTTICDIKDYEKYTSLVNRRPPIVVRDLLKLKKNTAQILK